MHGTTQSVQYTAVENRNRKAPNYQAGFNPVAQSCNGTQTPLEAAKGLQIPETVWMDRIMKKSRHSTDQVQNICTGWACKAEGLVCVCFVCVRMRAR